jgi:hypothetical protein
MTPAFVVLELEKRSSEVLTKTGARGTSNYYPAFFGLDTDV